MYSNSGPPKVRNSGPSKVQSNGPSLVHSSSGPSIVPVCASRKLPTLKQQPMLLQTLPVVAVLNLTHIVSSPVVTGQAPVLVLIDTKYQYQVPGMYSSYVVPNDLTPGYFSSLFLLIIISFLFFSPLFLACSLACCFGLHAYLCSALVPPPSDRVRHCMGINHLYLRCAFLLCLTTARQIYSSSLSGRRHRHGHWLCWMYTRWAEITVLVREEHVGSTW